MAKFWCHPRPFSSQLLPGSRRVHGFRCCSSAPNDKNREIQTPRLLKVAVSGVTELIRLFSFTGGGRSISVDKDHRDDIPVSSIDDVLSTIKSDYEKAYFVTGLFTSAIYANDCTFEDPTIKFRGKELYSRNLSLLVPFFEEPSIQLKKIEKGISSETDFIVASWTLRTYLKLPWKPFIFIDGKTLYDLDEQFRIVRHVESWNVSAFEAIGQIFTPSFGRPAK
ncbi:hypothetical protein Fot_47560 [Forsythia ovata]|uniref:Uncharacterized protein n=1 Tax=Forsythia ovata TaxID=205694 RepID=A0ABD1QRG3_9LAMI